MSRRTAQPFPWSRVVIYALAGAVIALIVGLIAVAVAPENGFADLAAAAVTKIFLVPFGAVAGAVIAWRKGMRGQ
jgi:RsiW-degrading membrane proteinase PrsW (M82 family)